MFTYSTQRAQWSCQEGTRAVRMVMSMSEHPGVGFLIVDGRDQPCEEDSNIELNTVIEPYLQLEMGSDTYLIIQNQRERVKVHYISARY